MIKELISFTHELFPSINPYTAEQAKRALDQFEITGRTHQYFFSRPFSFLVQGDIIGDLSFIKYQPDGQQTILKTKGILISNTCSSDKDKQIVFSPLISLNEVEEEVRSSVIGNKIFRLLYYPDQHFPDHVIDLSIVNSFPTELIYTGLNSQKFIKYASLNTLGYYIFLIKLTVHFLRAEDSEVQRDRQEQYQASL